MPGWNDPALNALDIVSDWLSRDTTSLLILDNADDKNVFFNQRPTDSQPSTVPLVNYLPQTSCGGSILITSRNKDAAFRLTGSAADPVEVPYMSKEDAVTLLCKKLPDDRSSDNERTELVELLESLPLAITQAASFIRVKRTRITVAEYSQFLRDRQDILLDDMGDLRRDPTIPSSVLLTWHISFDQIRVENRPAADLLSLMSVFDRQGIPRYLLQGEDEDKLDFERRLGPLDEFSLIAFEDGGESFQMHRLVQVAIKTWLERHREIDRWKQNAAVLLKESLPSLDYQSWKNWESLLPHSEVVLDYVLPNPASQILHAHILHWTGWYLKERGKYHAAEERCQRALNIRIDQLGEDDVEVAYSLRLLAILKGERGHGRILELDEIEAMNRRALVICERVRGKESVASLNARNDLAVILLRTRHDKKIEEATETFRSILASDIGLEDHRSLRTMVNLATALRYQYKYNEAETLYRKTLGIQLRIFGEEHPDTMLSMHNLAYCLTYQRRYEEAREIAQHALDLRVSVLGEEHPNTLHSMYHLSRIFNCLGKHQKAEELCRHALAILKTTLGEASEQTRNCTTVLSNILAKQHRFSEAEELCRHLVDIRTTRLGSDHSKTRSDIANLACLLYCQAKYEQAEELYREVYNRRPEGWSHSDWDRFLANFANTLSKQGKHEEAEELYREVYSRGPEGWSYSDWDIFLANFADTLSKQGKHDEAAEISLQRVRSEDAGSEMSAA